MPAGPPVELHAVPKGVPAVVPRATCVSPILQLRSESRAHERFVALEAKILPLSDDADDVIGRREVTKQPRHPASGQGNGSAPLTRIESLMETPDEWSRPPIYARIKWTACACGGSVPELGCSSLR